MSWQRIRAEFEALVGMPERARAARLHELAVADLDLAEHVQSLLDEDSKAGEFLERTAAPPLAPVEAGRRLGRFELVKPLGSGGMGIVWEARQVQPERRVAIKLVARGERSAVERWRFEHEVQVLATLNHPAIATFYEAGTDDLDGTEVAWFAMELVEGAVDVLTWARTNKLDRNVRLQAFLRLCDAVEHGHRRGVLHRDLKPGNVLVGRDGQLKLIDFGIARALGGGTAAPRHTLTSHVVGTLQYMAPEQLAGRTDAIGTPSDVYALGTILYQLLCDRAPFQFDGVPVARIADLVLEQEPLAPSRARPDLPAELGWILLRALEKNPARRYPTVQALADDLARFRNHLPVHAGPPSATYRLRKFIRRHRVAVAIAATLGIGLGAGGYGLWRGADVARAQAQRAELATQDAKVREQVAVRANEISRETLRVVASLFEGIDETEASRDLTVHELLATAAVDERATREPVVEQAIRELRGRTFARLRRFPEARVELERAWALDARPRSGPVNESEAAVIREHSLVLAAELGLVLVHTGDRARGDAMLRDAVTATSTGVSDRTRHNVLTTWCRWLSDENAFAELLDASTELGALAERTGNSAGVVLAAQRRAQAASGLGKHDLAVAESERAWRLARERFGDQHRVPCSLLFAHVSALQVARRLDAAEALYPELIATTRAVFGDGHANLLKVLNNQVDLLFKRGRTKAAIESLRQVVAAYDARGGKMTKDRVTAMHNLGHLLNVSNQFAEAEPLLQRAAEASRTVFGPNDPDGIWMRFNFGMCLAWQKRWAEGQPIVCAEYARLEAVLPAGHDNLANARKTVAAAFAHNGDAEGAKAWR